MENATRNNSIRLCAAFAKRQNVSHWRVSFLARRDGPFCKRLGDGKSCTLTKAARVMRWFSDTRPADLEWPRDIARPDKTKTGA